MPDVRNNPVLSFCFSRTSGLGSRLQVPGTGSSFCFFVFQRDSFSSRRKATIVKEQLERLPFSKLSHSRKSLTIWPARNCIAPLEYREWAQRIEPPGNRRHEIPPRLHNALRCAA
jgi:hypothetical protein